MSIVLAWGKIKFTPTKEGFDNLQHKMSFGWSKQELMNASPLYQATQGLDHEITITGKVYSLEIGHDQWLNILKKQGTSQKPYFMADGLGRIYGKFILLNVDGTASHHLPQGIAMKETYTMTFAEVSKTNKLFNLF